MMVTNSGLYVVPQDRRKAEIPPTIIMRKFQSLAPVVGCVIIGLLAVCGLLTLAGGGSALASVRVAQVTCLRAELEMSVFAQHKLLE